jgi:phosphoglycolate phosphatase
MNTIIVDFDGTIADSFDHILDFLLKEAGRQRDQLAADEYQRLRHLAMRDLGLQVGIPAWRLPLVYFRGKVVLGKKMGNIPVFPGIPEALASLHQDGFQLCIVSSNSRRNISRFLVQHGLSGYFTHIYGNVGWFSKGPVLKKLLKKLQLRADQAVYVGDEVRDMAGAHAAGIPAVAVTWGFASEEALLKQAPMLLIRSPQELQKALLAWGNEA